MKRECATSSGNWRRSATLVQKDPLTQVLNRRGLDDAFRVESARATRYGAPLAAVLIDLDNFKNLNDTLGHAAGDRALVHLVQVIRATLRPTDLIGRVGGEEFAIRCCRRRRSTTRSSRRTLPAHAGGEPVPIRGRHPGADLLRWRDPWHERESLDEIIKRADEAMYAAKRAGKNRVLKSA